MRSLRLDEELDARVRRAAESEQESVSEFLRKAAAERADRVLTKVDRPAKNSERLADIIGSVHSTGGSVHSTGGGDAHRTGEAFTDMLVEDWERKRRRQR